MDLRVLLQPSGIFKSIQIMFSIIAFATLTSYRGELVFEVYCQNANGSTTTTPKTTTETTAITPETTTTVKTTATSIKTTTSEQTTTTPQTTSETTTTKNISTSPKTTLNTTTSLHTTSETTTSSQTSSETTKLSPTTTTENPTKRTNTLVEKTTSLKTTTIPGTTTSLNTNISLKETITSLLGTKKIIKIPISLETDTTIPTIKKLKSVADSAVLKLTTKELTKSKTGIQEGLRELSQELLMNEIFTRKDDSINGNYQLGETDSFSLDEDVTENITVTVPISYPFRLKEKKIFTQNCKNHTVPFVLNNVSSSKTIFFVFTGVTSFIIALLMVLTYLFKEFLFSDEVLKLVELGVHAILAIFWFSGSIAWAGGLADLKLYLKDTVIEDNNGAFKCSSDNQCFTSVPDGYGGLITSIVFGFFNIILYGGNIWYIHKSSS